MSKISHIFAAFGIVTVAFMPLAIRAQSSETSFGGMHIVTLDSDVCTCSGNSHWIEDYKTNGILKLYYQAGSSTLYSNNDLDGTYELGSYSSGAESCEIEVGDDCVEITNDGTYGSSPGTGTSMRTDTTYATANILTWNTILAGNPYISEIKNFMQQSGQFDPIKKT